MTLKLESSTDTLLRGTPINIMGAPGVGKTFMAATMSQHYPEKLPAAPPVNLSDGIWILFDSGGLDGFPEQGLSVPTLDLSCIPGKEFVGALREVRTIAAKAAKEGAKFCVIDTVSTLDKLLLAALAEQYEKWGLYQAMLREHMTLYQSLRSHPWNVIALFHQKVKTDAGDAKGADIQLAKMAASGLEVGVTTLDISGQSLDAYRAMSSLTVPVRKVRKADGSYERICTPTAKGTDAKSRFACLGAQEPAHLGKIMAKVRAASKF